MKLALTAFVILNFFLSTAQDFKKIIFTIANDSFIGRAAGSVYETKTADYIANSLKVDFKVQFQDFEFYNVSGEKLASKNILAFSKYNNDDDSLIVLMAHYDHLGIGDLKSTEVLLSKKNQIHNGADDNASGVAMVIELGKYFAKKKSLRQNLLLLFTSAHEPGFFGAKNFIVKNNLSEMKIKAVYNFDMVGRLDENSKNLGVSFKNNQIDKLIALALNNGINIVNDNLIEHSDLQYFANKKKLSLMNITTGIHEDYHKTSDDAIKINYKGMKIIFYVLKKYIPFA